ncbi:SMI1/KNR4 family protein [Paenibacillus sp. MZ04-78.2]|uniref:SMI1/KNR4 family protein n=1 Tax=Paenibacillus sp. MZ04-78.2 TaxID=2962034 RepID=UPI0020B7352F|nr:SMI1/KNR4 family protein [Paenibacillus sp. MZ04-78.2]MCP3773302.1 SMI1/KNR4 family protein [Paenibacillus sp. MZ04-78.2]
MPIDKQSLIDQLTKLASCELSPEDWMTWWNDHDEQLQVFLSRGDYLRIKPRTHGMRWVSILASQNGAVQYLESNNIPFAKSDRYQENYKKELDEFVKAKKERNKRKWKQLQEEHPRLIEAYPKFANSLKNGFSEDDSFEANATIQDIKECERLMNIQLPQDVANFFLTVSRISLEGIQIVLGDVYMLDLSGKRYGVLGEFWKEADGDLILFDGSGSNTATTFYYYAHEENKVKPLAKSPEELMEKVFARYLRSL